ncbi:ABC transporter substrate-binding protein [Paenibacillus sp. FSL H8-0548]|uniref:ABC transporter substrate-binding protein n=1 Tax=Paenibacillus sp. FSL H8-0548 TaxID=1920422 RepID=UPI00097018A2|nr:ABC transporter substrate-binding protein [Paenibacillus sp. FSL H8-0548]OMF37595.1 ABC transporter substrate-binding protein [Paenibacillus sp. FSL H8-0548]
MFIMKSKRFYLSCLLIATILVAGCSQKSNTAANNSGDAAPAATTNSEVQQISQLTIAVPTDAGPLNIYSTSVDFMTDLVFDKLFGPSPYVDDPQPWLAESAEQLDSFNWVVKIRSGIEWHDGTPFTAEDVKFTYEYYRDGPQNRHSHHVSDVPQIDTIELLDENTVQFTCAYACPSLKTVTFADLPILAKHIWEKVENPRKYTELAVGTGPYKLIEYVPDQYYKFEANENFFMGKPVVDTLIMPIIKDQTAMFNSLRSGEIDAAAKSVPPELLGSFSNLADLKVTTTPELTIAEIRTNYERFPLNIHEFRNALSLAIDRQTITDIVLLGHARPAFQGYPHPDSPWTNPDLSTPYDADQSRSIMDSLKLIDRDGDGIRESEDGKKLDIELAVSSAEPTFIRTAELLKEQFLDVGINLKVEVMDAGTLSGISSERNFDLIIGNIGAHGVADPDQFIMSHRADYLWKKGLPYPEMDTLFESWKAETTIEGRKQISFDMQELFNRQPTSLALFYPEQNWAYRSDEFDSWIESPGYGIFHKYSLLNEEGRKIATGKA